MKVGDTVEWTSQSAGFEKTKRGVIEAVVPACVRPDICIPEGFRRSKSGFGMRRDHESYLVRVHGRNAQGRMTYGSRKLYWPRVSQLKVVGEGNGLGLCMEISSLKQQVEALQIENAELRRRLVNQPVKKTDLDPLPNGHGDRWRATGEAADNNR